MCSWCKKFIHTLAITCEVQTCQSIFADKAFYAAITKSLTDSRNEFFICDKEYFFICDKQDVIFWSLYICDIVCHLHIWYSECLTVNCLLTCCKCACGRVTTFSLCMLISVMSDNLTALANFCSCISQIWDQYLSIVYIPRKAWSLLLFRKAHIVFYLCRIG